MSRLLVFCCMVVMAYPAWAQTGCKKAFPGKEFTKSVVHSIKWQVFSRVKAEGKYLPRVKKTILKTIETALGRVQVEAFTKQLAHLSKKTSTSILFFSPEKTSNCVWLFSSSGDVYLGTSKPWKTFSLQRAFTRLDVSMTGLSRVRSARQRNTRSCARPQQQPTRVTRTGTDMKFRLLRVNRALKKLRKTLVPPNIYAQLLATGDKRLIIIPSRGRGMVPFAALPLGEGHFIDKFSILLAPGIAGLVEKQDLSVNIGSLAQRVAGIYRSRTRRSRRRARMQTRRRPVQARQPARTNVYDKIIRTQIQKNIIALQQFLKKPDLQETPFLLANPGVLQKQLDDMTKPFRPARARARRNPVTWKTYRDRLGESYAALQKDQKKFGNTPQDGTDQLGKDTAFILDKLAIIIGQYSSLRGRVRPIARRPARARPVRPVRENPPVQNVIRPTKFFQSPGRHSSFFSRRRRHAFPVRTKRVPLPAPNPLRSRKLREDYIIVGNPDLSRDRKFCWNDLPFAESEARFVASQFRGSTLFTGRQASFRKVYQTLKKKQKSARYIYFATHGVSDSVNPADASFLALSQRHLTGSSLRNLKFRRAPLVVMSACQTGLGKVFPGGMFGLAQAWYHAGAKKTVMTLWNVNDEATATLMKIFNRNLAARNSEQIDVAAAEFALADAIRTFKKDNPDPVYWAGISIYGTPSE